MNNSELSKAAALLGARSKGKPKTLTPEQREARRVWARGLARIRKPRKPNMRDHLASWQVIARDGQRHTIAAATGGVAMELARSQGIDAVGVQGGAS